MNEDRLYRKTINILGSVPITNNKRFNTFVNAQMPVSNLMKSIQNSKLGQMSINSHQRFVKNL